MGIVKIKLLRCAGLDERSSHLKQIIAEERERRQAGELPEQAPAPIMKRKKFKELGTLTPLDATSRGAG